MTLCQAAIHNASEATLSVLCVSLRRPTNNKDARFQKYSVREQNSRTFFLFFLFLYHIFAVSIILNLVVGRIITSNF